MTDRSRTDVDDYEFQERIEKTEYLVEADSYAQHHLWQEWSKEAGKMGYKGPYEHPRYTWEQMNPGCGEQVGTLDDRPVMLSLFWNRIGGALICFYCGMSQVVDHKMIETYLDEKFKGIKRTDAMNFHHIVGHLEERDPGHVVELEQSKRVFGQAALESFQNEGILTTRLMSEFSMEQVRRERRPTDPDAAAVMVQLADIKQRLDEAIEEFAEKVWGAWLKTYYREQEFRGLEANSGNVNLLVWGCAGRVMLSLRRRDYEDEALHVTLIGADGKGDGERLGLQGINFHCEKAIQLVQDATKNGPSLESDIRPNDKIGMG
jgi:hypothetical protein